MSRRVVLGTLADGSIGLRVSSAGHDALTAADDGSAITFDSRWTDIAKIGAVGLVSETLVNTGDPAQPFFQYCLVPTYPDFGYKPFIEMRRLDSGSVIYDDWWTSSFPAGSYAIIDRTSTRAASGTLNNGQAVPGGFQALFVVYQIPVPSQ
jgi:hypothetical protein